MTHFSKVRVEIRIKPTPDDVLDITATSVSIDKKHFEFDRVYNSQTQHKEIFVNSVLPLANSFLNLYNSTIFAYGQTGSGKTFTMGISIEALEEYERHINAQNRVDDLSLLTNNSAIIKNVSDLPSSENNLNYSLQHCSINDNNEKVKYMNNNEKVVSTLDNVAEKLTYKYENNTEKIVNTINNENEKQKYTNENITCINNNDLYFGIVPDSFGYIFKNKKENDKFSVTLLEIYNEEVIDLLSEFRNVLTLRQINGETNIAGAREVHVLDEKEAINTIKKGLLERTVKSTKMNILSSRSHAILTLNLYRNTNNTIKTSKFTFVDLAGSERMKRTLAQGTTAKESISINGGLLALSNVITALSKKSLFVPYRDSKLTRILQHGLGGNSNTLMIVNISGSSKDVNETFNTLKYANRASSISNQIKKCIEIDVNRTGVLLLKNENNRLKNENNELRNRLKSRIRSVEEERLIEINKENHKLREEIRRLQIKENTKELCKCKEEYEKVINEYKEKMSLYEKRISEYSERVTEYERIISEYKMNENALENKTNNNPQNRVNSTLKDTTDNNNNKHYGYNTFKMINDSDKENNTSNKNSCIINYDDCKKKRIVTFDLEKNKVINKNLSDEVIFGTGTITKRGSIVNEDTHKNSEVYKNNSINKTITFDNNLISSEIDKNNSIDKIKTFDYNHRSSESDKNRSINKITTFDKSSSFDFKNDTVTQNQNVYSYDKIEMKEPFILSLLMHNNLLYASTLNGKIYEIADNTNAYNVIANENDEIKTIDSYKNEIYYSYRNTIKRINKDSSKRSEIVKVENEISIFGIEKDFLIIGTVNGLFMVYEIKETESDNEFDVKLLFSEKIFTTQILCFTRSYNFNTSMIYVGSKDNQIACLKKDSINYLQELHYSAVQCLLSVGDVLISCGRDGCIKVYKDSTIRYTKEMAHTGSIKTAVICKSSVKDHSYSDLHFFTGGKDGVLKHWKINKTNFEMHEIGFANLNSCINDLMHENGILYVACMNRNICRIRIE